MKSVRHVPLFIVMLLLATMGLYLWLTPAPLLATAPQASDSPTAGPDLTVEKFEFVPNTLTAGAEVDITPFIKNIGDAAAPQIKLYLYVQPSEDPPTSTTTVTARFTFGLPLAAGETFDGWTRTNQPITEDNPQICVWVDPDNEIAESNEENNLFCRKDPPPPPGEEPTPDAYDKADDVDDDDTCENAVEITTDGVAQLHNLARTNDKDDEDWVKFSATSGIEYVIEAVPDGDEGGDADLFVNLQPDCQSASFNSGAKITFRAPETKEYYVQAGHNDTDYGPKTAYKLTVVGKTECSTFAEPNDTCTMPVDFALSTGSQTHSFCQEGDVDWIRFEVNAGGRYKISTENLGPNADAQLSIFPACDTSGLPDQQLTFTSPTAGYYYIKAENNDPQVIGAGTDYKVNIEVLDDGCQQDIYEEDNDTGKAQPLILNNSSPQTHNICPKGEQDWMKIDAEKGSTFTVETFDLAKDADTYLCIYDRGGNKLNCDRNNGEGNGSRVLMKDVTDDLYYARVTSEDDAVAGRTTEYKIQAISAMQADSHEPDNKQGEAKSTTPDDSAHEHNIHAPDDVDWVKFTAEADTSYIIYTEQMGEESDTEIALYNDAGARLSQNDDFSDDASSRIVYRISQAGDYYVRVRLYNPTLFGTGTDYVLKIKPGTVDPTPPPTQEPPGPPPATPEPPPTEAKTLILVNATRMTELHGADATNTLLAKLNELARHEKVMGHVIQLNRNTAVANAYDAWTGNSDSYKSVESANQVADAIRRLIMTYLMERSGIEYVLLVGDDRALPFRRVVDATPQQSEKTYLRVNDAHPTGSAIRNDYYLTDDFYVDREPTPHKGREVYIPDLAIGRLIEKPEHMLKVIQAFLTAPATAVEDVFVSGYDFVKDSASEDCVNWRRALGDDSKVVCVIGENWRKGDLLDNQVSTDPVFKIQSINGHADHDAEGVPDKTKVTAEDIAGAPVDLSGGFIYTLACHGGLNVPEENVSLTTDLAESFVSKGANYFANSGYGWGYRGALGLSETMMQLVTKRIIAGGPMGKAIAESKQEYYRLTQVKTGYDEKVMQQMIFYGLPMFETIGRGGTFGDDPFSGFADDNFDNSPGALGDETVVLTKTVAVDFTKAYNQNDGLLPLSTDNENDNTFGSYQTLAGYSYAQVNEPIQPLYFKDVSVEDMPVRSVVLRSAEIATTVSTNLIQSWPRQTMNLSLPMNLVLPRWVRWRMKQ